jgi:GNAT superfamily N-acetyltransferase
VDGVGVIVRRLGPGDEAVLARVARDAADFDLAGAGGPDAPLDDAAAAAYLTDPCVLHWVAEEGGAVVGELLCHRLRLPHGTGEELLLYAIGVRAARRRRGVGRLLLQAMRDWMAGAGVRDAWVLADNPGAEAFYAAHRFRRADAGEQGVLMTLGDATTGER